MNENVVPFHDLKGLSTTFSTNINTSTRNQFSDPFFVHFDAKNRLYPIGETSNSVEISFNIF